MCKVVDNMPMVIAETDREDAICKSEPRIPRSPRAWLWLYSAASYSRPGELMAGDTELSWLAVQSQFHRARQGDVPMIATGRSVSIVRPPGHIPHPLRMVHPTTA